MVSVGRDVNKDCSYTMLQSGGDVVRFLGMMFDKKLNFREHNAYTVRLID